jgi:iron(III) transport system substrate-binding protein
MPRLLRLRSFAAVAAVAAVFTLSLALAACGSSGSDEGGEEEPIDNAKLVVYSGRNEGLIGPLLEQFQEETGIETSVRYGDTASLAAQLLEEGDRTDADVFFGQDAGSLGALEKAELLTTIPQEQLNLVEPRFRSDDGRWVGTSGRARVIVYDPQQVPEDQVPSAVADLTQDRWRGQVGIAPSNASFESFVTALRVVEGEDAAHQWLEGMHHNDVETFDNNVLILDAVDQGQLQLGLINHYYWFEEVAESGEANVRARLKFLTNGDIGGLVNVAAVGILDGTDRSAEAEQLVSFLLSQQAQQYFAEETKEYPVIAGVPTAAGLPPLTSLNSPQIDLSDLDSLEQTLQMIEEAGLT